MTEPAAEVWQAITGHRTYITFTNMDWIGVSAGPAGVETSVSCTPADMRALVDQIVAGLAKLEKPTGEGA